MEALTAEKTASPPPSPPYPPTLPHPPQPCLVSSADGREEEEERVPLPARRTSKAPVHQYLAGSWLIRQIISQIRECVGFALWDRLG